MKTHYKVTKYLPDLNKVTMHWDEYIEIERSLCGSLVTQRTADIKKVTCKKCQKLWGKG